MSLFDIMRQLGPTAAALGGGALGGIATARRSFPRRRGNIVIDPDVYQLGLNVLGAVRQSTVAPPVRTPSEPAGFAISQEYPLPEITFPTHDRTEHLTLVRDAFSATGYRLTLWHRLYPDAEPQALMTAAVELETLRGLYMHAQSLHTPAAISRRNVSVWGREQGNERGYVGDLPRRTPGASLNQYGTPSERPQTLQDVTDMHETMEIERSPAAGVDSAL